MAANTEHSQALYTELVLFGVKDARGHSGVWSVIVASKRAFRQARCRLPGLVEPGDLYSGRTIQFPCGGRVSLSNELDMVNVEGPSRVLFVGTIHKDVVEAWQAKAKTVLKTF